jgi:hypothetical protein
MDLSKSFHEKAGVSQVGFSSHYQEVFSFYEKALTRIGLVKDERVSQCFSLGDLGADQTILPLRLR